jgi:hypothetical protein
MNKAKLLKLAQLIKQPVEDEVPDGYFSREQLQEVFNMGKENTCKVIKKYINDNPTKASVKKLRRRNSSGTISIVPYYKIDV